VNRIIKNIYILIFLICLSVNKLFPQIYSFPEIRENFLRERPQGGDLTIRNDCFGSMDDLILGTYPPLHPESQWFFTKMLDKALVELKTEPVSEGASIWQIYNHGFIVKTPSVTFGIDLHDYFRTPQFLELANLIDAYFITHEHADHFSYQLISLMQSQNKPVVGPAEFPPAPIKMNAGDNRQIASLNVIAHDGLHGDIPLRQYEIITLEGLKILHTGDNQTSETLPLISNVDILLLNSWINESGGISWIEGVRIAIEKIKPKVTLPGHMMELGHLGAVHPPVPYRDPIASDNGNLASEYYILGWGERYHFGNSTNDTVRPNIVQNLNAEVYRDSILISWETSQATDGDFASFYRIIIDDKIDSLIIKKQLIYPIDSLRTYNFKVYSYDDCGNQSENHAEVSFTTPSTANYPPRITNFFPLNDDTVQTFEGVFTLFNIEAMDFNGDDLTYKWILDQQVDLNTAEARYEFRIADLDSGLHKLTSIVSDQQDSTIKSWVINYNNDFAIVDNEDSIMYSDYGSWKTSNLQKAYGISCRTSGISNIGDYALYKFYPPRQGEYDIFEIILETSYASNSVLYNITINDQSIDSVYLDQNSGSGEWVKIGSYYFPEDSEVSVTITNTGIATGGYSIVSDAIKFNYKGDVNEIEEINGQIPKRFFLAQNYPNPFNPSTTIKYSIPSSSVMLNSFQHLNGEIPDQARLSDGQVRNDATVETHGHASVQLGIYDILGREVATLVNEKQIPGYYEVKWNSSNQPSGVYFYKLSITRNGGQAGDFIETKKMILLK